MILHLGPFVTSVGGTNGTTPEQGVIFSGGGFSDYFGRPSYQSTAVETFLGTLGTGAYAGLFKCVVSRRSSVDCVDPLDS